MKWLDGGHTTNEVSGSLRSAASRPFGSAASMIVCISPGAFVVDNYYKVDRLHTLLSDTYL